MPESDSQDEQEEAPAVLKQANKKPQPRPALVLSTERSDYRDIPESLGGPGQLVVAKKASKNSCPKLHIRLQTGVCVGCGWKPGPLKIEVLNSEMEYLQERTGLTQCSFCFKRYCIPLAWERPPPSPSGSDSSESSESEDQSPAESDTDSD